MDYQLVDMLIERLKYAHAQEELRPLGSRLNNRNSLEPIIRQPYISPQSSNSSPFNTFTAGNVKSTSTVNAKSTSNLYRASPFPSSSPSPSPDHSSVSARTSTYHSAVSVLSSPSPSQSPNHLMVSARPSSNHSMVSELTSPYHSSISVLPSPSPPPNHSMLSALPSPNHSMDSGLGGSKGMSTNWSPLDDGINGSDPMSREDADHYIHMLLYGPSTRSKRLPVFADICSDCNSFAHLSL